VVLRVLIQAHISHVASTDLNFQWCVSVHGAELMRVACYTYNTVSYKIDGSTELIGFKGVHSKVILTNVKKFHFKD